MPGFQINTIVLIRCLLGTIAAQGHIDLRDFVCGMNCHHVRGWEKTKHLHLHKNASLCRCKVTGPVSTRRKYCRLQSWKHSDTPYMISPVMDRTIHPPHILPFLFPLSLLGNIKCKMSGGLSEDLEEVAGKKGWPITLSISSYQQNDHSPKQWDWCCCMCHFTNVKWDEMCPVWVSLLVNYSWLHLLMPGCEQVNTDYQWCKEQHSSSSPNDKRYAIVFPEERVEKC